MNKRKKLAMDAYKEEINIFNNKKTSVQNHRVTLPMVKMGFERKCFVNEGKSKTTPSIPSKVD